MKCPENVGGGAVNAMATGHGIVNFDDIQARRFHPAAQPYTLQ